MLAQGESVEAHALRARGWTISAIARHLRKNRETIRAYLNGHRVPGVRAPAGPDAFGGYAVYCGQRLADDPHLFTTALFDEVRELGYGGGYPVTPAAKAGMTHRNERNVRCWIKPPISPIDPTS
jgi:hypothetical protein